MKIAWHRVRAGGHLAGTRLRVWPSSRDFNRWHLLLAQLFLPFSFRLGEDGAHAPVTKEFGGQPASV